MKKRIYEIMSVLVISVVILSGISIGSQENQPPNKPTIVGPINPTIGQKCEYTFRAVDPDGHDVEFNIQWDLFHTNLWWGPFESGEEFTIEHTWLSEGNNIISCKARDIHGAKSELTRHHVTVPVHHTSILYKIFIWILELFNINF